ncbi:NADPH:quinone reductase [Mycolicibacterium parafortuitum]|uniref:Alcohol dehydrogenase zinc-binding domain-containing protein [Kineococcus radiotolerans = ATCC BAA-149] n=1 Tax=Mycolicibacterium parafortuitum TaxID=39692 RepID=A0A375YRH6_MYCPF|nr:NADPH:quinone reductase [Mycolicibacterium parafortuitum]ORB29499.1 NADPH:quinone reductase [Mycolicibacterium parafortuitum]SRX83680.1 alcohol dehydrogenase zinc-binding domain-containing protein [Kineococcus radiotolerans = ATCC BAA-149] [Mycolicibacterium parafortuitum]
MKAITYSRTGDSSVLHLRDREVPEPGAGQVRVRVVVSGVNPTDWKHRKGAGPDQELEFPEVVPHHDGAGVVDAVGDGVSDLAVGDRVWVFMAQLQRPDGTAQEYVVLPVVSVVPLPDDVGFDVGASLGVPAITAHRALTVAEGRPSRLAPGALAGATVLVAGGAGAVGHAAIQLARWAGARVITTVSTPEKEALAAAAGADHVVNYKAGDTAAAIRAVAPDGVDIVVEVAPGANAALDAAVVSNRATIAIYANDGGGSVELDVMANMWVNARYQFLVLYTVGDDALANGRDDVAAAVRDGAMGVGESNGLPVHHFSLEDTAAAHDAVENGVTGKVLIRVSG